MLLQGLEIDTPKGDGNVSLPIKNKLVHSLGIDTLKGDGNVFSLLSLRKHTLV